jgi:multicomponent Na+:H+ antiporter subunit E
MTAQPHLLRRTAVRTWRIVRFVIYFGWEFLLSNAAVLWEILTPGDGTTPAIIAAPLRSRSRMEIVSFANLITLTPGTLSVELLRDPPVIYLHGMFVRDVDAFLAQLRRLEDRMLAALRPVAVTDADHAAGGGGRGRRSGGSGRTGGSGVTGNADRRR